MTWRRARGLVLFGGFGLLLSVGVAWGLRHWHYSGGYPAVSRWTTGQTRLFMADDTVWRLSTRAGLGRWRYEFGPDPTYGPNGDGNMLRPTYPLRVSVPGWVELPARAQGLHRTLTVAYGWPFPAMAEGVHNANTLGVERVWIWTPGNRDARGLRRARPMLAAAEFGFPIRPVWWGLLGNAAIYAAACWTAVGGVRWSWRRLRYKRGACVACGYDLAGLPEGAGCPECGAVIEPAA